MGTITNIKITNIKGFGTTNNSHNIEIKSGRINILVAPNGFGKSSITAAFDSLKTRKIELDKRNWHKGNETLDPILSIVEEGNTYVANKTKNTISSSFKVFCIKNHLNAKAISKNMGGYVTTTGHLSIDDIEVIKTIPNPSSNPYSISDIKRSFGCNGKVLNDISRQVINNDGFLSGIDSLYTNLDKFSTSGRQKIITDIIDVINSLKGTGIGIKASFNPSTLDTIKHEENYTPIVQYITSFFPSLSELDQFLYFYQIQLLYSKSKTVFKNTVNRSKYNLFKDSFNKNIILLGETWKGISAKEEGRSLIVKFPQATEISYGQRDLLTLCINLQVIKSKIRSGDKCIIVIDEVFDYLDSANMTATQYYLSEAINKLKRECTIYPIIMTHLSPEYFSNYAFSRKKMNIQYLMNYSVRTSENMRKLLIKRMESSIKNEVSQHLFHFSTGEINKRAEFRTLSLAEMWGEGLNFLQYITDETNKYLQGDEIFEPYAVCLSLRIRIEKLVYESLENHHRQGFLDVDSGTKPKLEYAESILGELPDIYFMLGIIYNDAAHITENTTEKPAIYRLNHTIIKEMIQKIFSFSSTPIDLSYIH